MPASILKPVLHGERVTLRPLQAKDIPGFAQQILLSLQDPEQNRFTGTHATFTSKQIQDFYAKAILQTDRADYRIVPNGQNQAIGEAVLNEIDWDNHAANFRIAIFDAAQHNKGFGSEATRLMLRYAFETLSFEGLRLHRVALEVYAFNPRAIRAYEKAGFVREGCKRDALFWEGTYTDAIVMAVLASDYRNV